MMETTYDMSGSVSASMNYLTLQTPSKKSRRNKEDSHPVITSKICLVGRVCDVKGVQEAAESFGVPVFHSEDGLEFVNPQHDTVFVLYEFSDEVFEVLYKKECRILGYSALLDIVSKKYLMPELDRPLFSISMENVVSCFTGFRNREEVNTLVSCIHHMGGSIRKEFDCNKITHLIANKVGGEKYQYAVTFNIPVMSASWVHLAWEKRHDLSVRAIDSTMQTNNALKIFEGTNVCWIGINDEEVTQMNEILTTNGGSVTTLDDPNCTHVVIDPLGVGNIPEKLPSKAMLVEVKWFWVSIQMDICASEKLYPYKETHLTSPRNGVLSPTTPGSRNRKRKRLRDTVSQLAAQGGSPGLLQVPSSGHDTHRRRSSISESGLLSLSGSFLDATSPEKVAGQGDLTISVPTPQDLKAMSPRHQVFMELLHTEMNYVEILETIVEVFKKPLEDPSQVGGSLLDPTEVKIIFGNLPPIHEIHFELLVQLKNTALNWREDISVGALILKHSHDLVKAYPPFVNFFEQTKEVLSMSDRSKPRFHAFLKLGQSNPKCRRQSLQELLIRPVQRLPSISLLLNDLLKQTPKSNPDYGELEKALSTIKEVMTHINEDKRRTEGQVVLFDIFNDIENCPAHIVSSHRSFVSQCDVIELGDGIVGRGGQLTLFLFSDVIEICKRRSRGNTLRRDVSTISLQPPRGGADKGSKPTYKHVELISVSHVKRVIDITETEDCQNVFALICRSHYETKERLYSFEITSEDVDKVAFLKTLCRLMANITCRADAENYLACMEARQLDIDTGDLASGTLRRAARLASKTRMAVNRAFSFSKTPNRLKRAMSTVMSPLRSSNTSILGDTSLVSPMMNGGAVGMAASCANLAMMDSDTGLKTTPSSSTLKNFKSNSLGFNAHKRL
ncbi:protein ECT2-like [Daphnia pulicaria]|uniref:protein ECT2-like n=1 Tax=Daphnia pulicaria TaxID=35523 RepID=UPI001EECA37B|nr:protein ECT2-like [Daphnia pulicaria]